MSDEMVHASETLANYTAWTLVDGAEVLRRGMLLSMVTLEVACSLVCCEADRANMLIGGNSDSVCDT